MGDIVSELTAEDFLARRAAQRTAREHADLVALAAARTAAHGFALLERSRARQARAMKPWLLPVGALVRVSYLHTPTARQQLKSQLVRAMSPSYSLEPSRAPQHARYVVRMRAHPRHSYRVQLPLELTDVDRRHLMPATTSGPPSTARTFAGMRLADRQLVVVVLLHHYRMALPPTRSPVLG